MASTRARRPSVSRGRTARPSPLDQGQQLADGLLPRLDPATGRRGPGYEVQNYMYGTSEYQPPPATPQNRLALIAEGRFPVDHATAAEIQRWVDTGELSEEDGGTPLLVLREGVTRVARSLSSYEQSLLDQIIQVFGQLDERSRGRLLTFAQGLLATPVEDRDRLVNIAGPDFEGTVEEQAVVEVPPEMRVRGMVNDALRSLDAPLAHNHHELEAALTRVLNRPWGRSPQAIQRRGTAVIDQVQARVGFVNQADLDRLRGLTYDVAVFHGQVTPPAPTDITAEFRNACALLLAPIRQRSRIEAVQTDEQILSLLIDAREHDSPVGVVETQVLLRLNSLGVNTTSMATRRDVRTLVRTVVDSHAPAPSEPVRDRPHLTLPPPRVVRTGASTNPHAQPEEPFWQRQARGHLATIWRAEQEDVDEEVEGRVMDVLAHFSAVRERDLAALPSISVEAQAVVRTLLMGHLAQSLTPRTLDAIHGMVCDTLYQVDVPTEYVRSCIEWLRDASQSMAPNLLTEAIVHLYVRRLRNAFNLDEAVTALRAIVGRLEGRADNARTGALVRMAQAMLLPDEPANQSFFGQVMSGANPPNPFRDGPQAHPQGRVNQSRPAIRFENLDRPQWLGEDIAVGDRFYHTVTREGARVSSIDRHGIELTSRYGHGNEHVTTITEVDSEADYGLWRLLPPAPAHSHILDDESSPTPPAGPAQAPPAGPAQGAYAHLLDEAPAPAPRRKR